MCGASVGWVDVKKTLRCFLKEGQLIFFRFDCQVMNTTGYVSRDFKLLALVAGIKWDALICVHSAAAAFLALIIVSATSDLFQPIKETDSPRKSRQTLRNGA
jgi:hypothetical protein